MCKSEISQNKGSLKGVFWETGGRRNECPLSYICKLSVSKVWFFEVCVWPRIVAGMTFVGNLWSAGCACVSTGARSRQQKGDLCWWAEGRHRVDTWDMSLFCSLVGWASLAEVSLWGKYSFSRVLKDDFCKYLLMFTWHLQSLMSIWSHPGMLTGNKHKSGHELSWCGYSF